MAQRQWERTAPAPGERKGKESVEERTVGEASNGMREDDASSRGA